MGMNRKIKKHLRRSLAVFLSAATALQTAALPAEGSLSLRRAPFADLAPSPAIASLVSSSISPKGRSATPQVILIEDLHFNYSVQRNIARLLDFLAKKGMVGGAMAVEGAAGPVDNSLLTGVHNRKVRAELADFLMQNGELTGTQYYSVMSGQPKILQGIEAPAYFQANRNVFRESYAARMEALRQVTKLKERLLALIPAVYSRPVRKLEAARRALEEGRLALPDYWAIVHSRGEAARVGRPPVLARYLMASSKNRDGLVVRGDFYQALMDYTVAVEAALAKTIPERNLVQLIQEMTLAERALAQHTTLEEIRHVAARLEHTALLARQVYSALSPDLALDVNALKEALRASVDFYVAALMRNRPMLENTLALLGERSGAAKSSSPAVVGGGSMDSGLRHAGMTKRSLSKLETRNSKLGTVVLVAGGFHTDYFTRELARRGISYVVFAPGRPPHARR